MKIITSNKPKQYYRIIHEWLHKHHGKPNHCGNQSCDGLGIRYEYALIHGRQHDRNINNYIQLCSKCHRNYDMTPEKSKEISIRIAGRFNENLKFGPISLMRKVVLISENRVFDSGKDLADYLGCNKASVYMVLSGKRKSIYGKKIRYANN
jgi:hypothetical protein